MIIGYARVSTQEQKLNSQIDALKKAGCEKIYREKVSGAGKERPELQDLLYYIRPGDTVVIYKLDRLGRSLKDLIGLVDIIQSKGASIKSLNDNIDTGSPGGKFIFNVFGALAEFERDIIRERTKAGLNAARARGRMGGRPKGLSPEAEKKAKLAETLYNSQEYGVNDIARQLNISKGTLYKYLRHREVKISDYKN